MADKETKIFSPGPDLSEGDVDILTRTALKKSITDRPEDIYGSQEQEEEPILRGIDDLTPEEKEKFDRGKGVTLAAIEGLKKKASDADTAWSLYNDLFNLCAETFHGDEDETAQIVDRLLDEVEDGKKIVDRALLRKIYLVTYASVMNPELKKEMPKNVSKMPLHELEKLNRQYMNHARENWQFAIHGVNREDERGNIYVEKISDLDAKCALEMFRRAGFKHASLEEVEYVPKGEDCPGRLAIDTGADKYPERKQGLVISGPKGTAAEGQRAYIDHDHRNRLSSATLEVYQVLVAAGFLDEMTEQDREIFRRISQFVNIVDNKQYLDDPKFDDYFKNYPSSFRTMLGLARYADFDLLYRFFRDNLTGGRRKYDYSEFIGKITKPMVLGDLGPKGEILAQINEKDFPQEINYGKADENSPLIEKKKGPITPRPAEMRKRNGQIYLADYYDLLPFYKNSKGKTVNAFESQAWRVRESLKRLKERSGQGFLIGSKRYGKIFVDIVGEGGGIPEGIDAVKAMNWEETGQTKTERRPVKEGERWGVYVKWDRDNNRFYVNTTGKKIKERFSRGDCFMGTMYFNQLGEEPLKIELLQEILEKLTDGQFRPQGKLKEFMELEKQRIIEEEKKVKKGDELFKKDGADLENMSLEEMDAWLDRLDKDLSGGSR